MPVSEKSAPAFRKFTPAELLGPLNESETKNVPPVLWVAGRHQLLKTTARVSIVGSREATPDGLKRAARLARALARNGIAVVSGLARGIDAAAHRAAIDAGGATIAVLGTPLDRFYPKENESLQREIMEEHLAVSQFPPGGPVEKGNFIMRNRTMALLVNSSVIVEAGETSGSLSQGWEALRLGRTLFLLRSIVDRDDLKWPKEMLDYGAVVLTEEDDLLEAVPRMDDDTLEAAAF